jgi:hypothetical protein
VILYCDACGKRADAGNSVMCGPCNDDRVRARAAAHAAGYAEAVADIRQMLRDARDATTEGRIAPGLARAELLIDRGAHVGAAKKGGRPRAF